MSLDLLKFIVRELMDLFVREDYEGIVKRCVRSRLTSDDLRTVILSYGRRVVSPPVDAYNGLDAVQVVSATVPTWSVHAPLWTAEEGRSDLTLELTVALESGGALIELDDLQVL